MDGFLQSLAPVGLTLVVLGYALVGGTELGLGMLRGPSRRQPGVVPGDVHLAGLAVVLGFFWLWYPRGLAVLMADEGLGPVLLLLAGLWLRLLAGWFTLKAGYRGRRSWGRVYRLGSGAIGFGLGWWLARLVSGEAAPETLWAFQLLVGVGTVAGCCLLGACACLADPGLGAWQGRALVLGRRAARFAAAGVAAVSVMAMLMHPAVLVKWLSLPGTLYLLPLPLLVLAAFVLLALHLRRPSGRPAVLAPLGLAVALTILTGLGLAYSLDPFLVMGDLALVDALTPAASRVVGGMALLALLPWAVEAALWLRTRLRVLRAASAS